MPGGSCRSGDCGSVRGGAVVCKQAEAMAAMEPHFQVWLQCPCCAACSMAWDNAVGPWIHQLELVDAPMAEKVVRHEELDAHTSEFFFIGDDVLDSGSAVGVDDGDSAPVDEHLLDDGVAAIERCTAGVLRTAAQKLRALSWQSKFRVVGKQEAVATAPATCKRAQRGSKRGRGSGKAAVRPAQHEEWGWAGECRAIDGSTAWRLQWVLAVVLVCGVAGACVLGPIGDMKGQLVLHEEVGAHKFEPVGEQLAEHNWQRQASPAGDFAEHGGSLAEYFQALDRDANGFIEAEELRYSLAASSDEWTVDEINAEFWAADVYGDGHITYKEYEEYSHVEAEVVAALT
mmetsp:Transcript_44916/g.88874  ORF Transcript_44916/g.88874 Transcript_44916/m.88874 type:complete len:344 (-) Transcript_44916:206-1237(-)